MSESVFLALDTVSSQGLEAMLREVVRVSFDDHDYLMVAKAKTHLKRLTLGLPECPTVADVKGRKELFDELQSSEKNFMVEAAELYKTDGDFDGAGHCFLNAERVKDAIDMYLRDGSSDSLSLASFCAINSGIDYKLGFDLRMKGRNFSQAFGDLRGIEFSDSFRLPERQQWGEYITRGVYVAVVEDIKKDIERQEGKTPSGETIFQLLEGRDGMSIIVDDIRIDTKFSNSLMYVHDSNNPEIIQIGIELNALLSRNASSEYAKMNCERTDMFLKGKLTGSDEYVQYFIKNAEEQKERDGFSHYDAVSAINILRQHGRYDTALEVAERFLSPNDSVRFELLEKIGDVQKLASALREVDNPIEYALVVAESKK